MAITGLKSMSQVHAENYYALYSPDEKAKIDKQIKKILDVNSKDSRLMT